MNIEIVDGNVVISHAFSINNRWNIICDERRRVFDLYYNSDVIFANFYTLREALEMVATLNAPVLDALVKEAQELDMGY